jgi:hypothetical protein
MKILLPAFAVAFAAFCIWLTVRIVNRRERWAKWTAVLVGLPVLYVASFGPACWCVFAVQEDWATRTAAYCYWPLTRSVWALNKSDYPIELLIRYALLWEPDTDNFAPFYILQFGHPG